MTKKRENAGRVNNTDNYRDREAMKGEKEYLGEDVTMGKGKGSDRKRLFNEIDDNMYDAEAEVKVIDDPQRWDNEHKVVWGDTKDKNYAKSLKKYIRIIKRGYKWLMEDEDGRKVTSVIHFRTLVGLTKGIWDVAEENSEEFLHYATLIKEIVGARIHELGVTDSKGQIFKIFSIKNLLPDEFADKKEVTKHERIEVISISQGTEKDIKKAIEEGKDRLKK